MTIAAAPRALAYPIPVAQAPRQSPASRPAKTLTQLHSHRAGKPSHLSAKVCAMTGSLLTASEVAELLGVPKSWVTSSHAAGEFPR